MPRRAPLTLASSSAPSSSSAQQPPAPPAAITAAAASTTPQGGVSEKLKAANKALIEKIKRQLNDTEFGQFKTESGQFMRGDMNAEAYHDRMVGGTLVGAWQCVVMLYHVLVACSHGLLIVHVVRSGSHTLCWCSVAVQSIELEPGSRR